MADSSAKAAHREQTIAFVDIHGYKQFRLHDKEHHMSTYDPELSEAFWERITAPSSIWPVLSSGMRNPECASDAVA